MKKKAMKKERNGRPVTGERFVPVLEYTGTVSEWQGPAERSEEDAVGVLKGMRKRATRTVIGARIHVSGIIHVPLRELA